MENPLRNLWFGRGSDAVVARPQISAALVWVAIWVCGLSGLILGAFAVFTDLPHLVVPAIATSAIGLVGMVQRALSKPHPPSILFLTAVELGVMVPFVDLPGHLVILSALVMLGALGALALPKSMSLWYALLCGATAGISLFWVLPDEPFLQILLLIVLLLAVPVGGWRFVSIASELLVREEMSHRSALDTNRRLLEFEHALALCSRALLMGSGEEALEAALERLREAIGSESAYLAMNVDDPELGLSFQVVKSSTRPGVEDDEWVGNILPWSKYRVVADQLSAGRPFRHVATDEPGAGWDRSILSVPVFIDGRWVASVGFIGIARQTVWDEEATRMLQVAAPMLGTFWERETTRKRLEELIESKDRFVASVSHELRTPLAAVLGFAEELRDHSSSFGAEELSDMLELIADQSQDMADMVEDLLVSARADIGTVSIQPQDVYLRAQAETVLAAIGSTEGKTIEVVGGRGKVWADPTRTRQIIRNLITNAIRYGGDQVTIEATESEDLTVLVVADNGEGLDPAHWEAIFEPYQRVHEAPTQPASIGLGLTVSRQLARIMGGDLVYRADDEGSSFSLTLPSSSPEGDTPLPAEDSLVAAQPLPRDPASTTTAL